ncbi:MAG: NADH-quinone oxidoreductase subunit L [Proteobacteria bacterium]|nr:NADH-quinone oxidoreductase subunit L [Pseudomonadota bacterium]
MSETIESNIPLWILLLPLCGFLINGLIYPLIRGGLAKTHNTVAGSIASLAMAASFVAACLGFQHLAEGSAALRTVGYQWVKLADFSVSFNLHLDRLSSIMTLIITGIGSLIHLYSIAYMSHEKASARFFAYLNLFCFAMLLLVLSDNLLLLFFGWEGVGLCSYLLISYWYEDSANADAARKAFLVNRVGDLGFVLAMCLLYARFGTLSFVELMAHISPEAAAFLIGVSVLLFFAATGKSAQFPLYVWLPDAMAGPTPVSALIHAATMVTAGVYLFARLHFVFELAPQVMSVVAWTGAITALLGGTIALAQNDIKKVLAYSTVSQLGFMFLATGLGAYHVAMFHLMTHAFFKALLFLGAGSVIHACDGEQDLRKMGGLAKVLPITHLTMLLGSAALLGLPFFSGFFSKDAILYAALNMPRGGEALFAAGLLGAFLTAIYTIRLLHLCFWGSARGKFKAHESPWLMTVPLMVLALLASLGGILGLPEEWAHALGLDAELLSHWLNPVVPAAVIDASQVILSEHFVSALAVGLSFLGLAFGFLLFRRRSSLPIAALDRVLEGKYFIDELYSMLLVKPLHGLSQFLAKILEVRFLQNIGSWMGFSSLWSGDRLRLMQNGDLQVFALAISAGLAFIVAISLFWTHV